MLLGRLLGPTAFLTLAGPLGGTAASDFYIVSMRRSAAATLCRFCDIGQWSAFRTKTGRSVLELGRTRVAPAPAFVVKPSLKVTSLFETPETAFSQDSALAAAMLVQVRRPTSAHGTALRVTLAQGCRPRQCDRPPLRAESSRPPTRAEVVPANIVATVVIAVVVVVAVVDISPGRRFEDYATRGAQFRIWMGSGAAGATGLRGCLARRIGERVADALGI